MFFIFSAFCIKHQLPFCAKSLCFSMTFDFFYQVKTTFWNIMETTDKAYITAEMSKVVSFKLVSLLSLRHFV